MFAAVCEFLPPCPPLSVVVCLHIAVCFSVSSPSRPLALSLFLSLCAVLAFWSLGVKNCRISLRTRSVQRALLQIGHVPSQAKGVDRERERERERRGEGKKREEASENRTIGIYFVFFICFFELYERLRRCK